MWRSHTYEEKLEAGKTRVHIRFDDEKWKYYIVGVDLVPKEKRKKINLQDQFLDKSSYRRLSMEDRKKYEMSRYIETVGVEVLNNALNAAWEASKPKLIIAEDYDVERGVSD